MDASKPQSAPHQAPQSCRVSGTSRSSDASANGSRSGRTTPGGLLEGDTVPRKPSSAGVVSRVLVDVVASRRDEQRQHRMRQDSSGSVLASRESVLTRATTALSTQSTALSVKSVCKMERELGRSLPIDASGTHVTLSSSDLVRVRDSETLKFLEQHSALFVKYFQPQGDEADVSSSSKNDEDTKNPSRFQPVDAGEVAAHVKALCDEIETFITAVDYEGASYRVCVDGNGELHVPVDVLGGGEEEDSVANMDDFSEADMAAFDSEFGADDSASLLDEESEQRDAERLSTDDHPPPLHNPFRSDVDADRDSACSDVLQGSMASTETPEDALRQRFDEHRKLLALTGELRLQKKLELVVAHHKGQRPRYMQPTKAKGVASAGMPPSPPPAGSSSEPRTTRVNIDGRFAVQYCGRRPGGGSTVATNGGPIAALLPPKVPPKMQMGKLTADEEDRVRFLLEHDDWDKAPMVTDAAENEPTSSASSAASVVSSATVASGLSYDRRSAASYAPALGGYKPESAAEKRLRTIDEKLAMLQKVRGEGGDDDSESQSPLITDRSGGSGSASVPLAYGVSASRPRGGMVPSSAVSVAPSTKAAEDELQAAEKRRQLGDGYLQRVKEEKHVRERLSALNEKLRDISSNMDQLSTPPFSFQLGYDMEKDPKDWQWPESLQKPSEDAIQALLRDAQREQRSVERQTRLSQLAGCSDSERAATDGLSNQFAPPSQHIADAPVSFFHEQLRDRMKRALQLAAEAESATYRGASVVADVEDADVAPTEPNEDGEG